jgi:hypothetical protein
VSVLLDGANDRVEHANPPSPSPTVVTIIAWIKPAAYDVNNTVHCYFGPSERHGLLITAAGSTGTIRFRAPFTTNPGLWHGPDDLLTTNAWQAIAVVYDGSSDANNPVMYYKPEGGAFSTPAVTEVSAPSGTLQTDADGLWTGGIFGSYLFTGRIVYVRSFEGMALNAAQVEAEMDSPTAVLAGDDLDCPFIADADDDSGNARHGTLQSGAAIDGDNPTLGGGGGGSPLLLSLLSRLMRTDVRQKNATNQSFDVQFLDSTTGAPKTGLVAAGMDIKYHRAGAAAVAITEVDLTALTDAHSDGGVFEIGNGVYRLDVPDAAFATGVDRVTLYGSGTGAVMVGIDVTLSSYDPVAAGASPTDIRTEMDSNSTQLAAILADTAVIGAPTGASIGADIAAVASGIVTLLTADVAYKKNTACPSFVFFMELTDGTPGTGLAVTASISKDGAAFVNTGAGVVEIAAGWYKVDLAQAEMNADEIAFKATAAGAKQRNIKIRTQA